MSFHVMIVSHLLLILHKKYSFISLCLKPEMWQKVAKFKGAEYFRKALYILTENVVVGDGNFRIFGGLPKPGFRYCKDIRVGGVY